MLNLRKRRKWLALLLGALMLSFVSAPAVSAEEVEKAEETVQDTAEEDTLTVSNAPVPFGEGTGTTAEDPMTVPEEGMVISGGTYYGISKTWFQTVSSGSSDKLYFSVSIPGNVTTIASDGFRDSYSSDKKNYGAVTYNDNLGRYDVTVIDFSGAASLTVIKSQAAMNCSLTGVLDLSATKITTIEKSAFSGCSGLTGVILPSTLQILGASDGSSGSVFNGCSNLQFMRTAGANPEALFELPSGLEVIGKQTFRNTFPKGSDLKIRIPESVRIIGSEAFYSNSCFSQIYIDRENGYEGYDSGAFKAAAAADCLLILPNSSAYNSTGSFTRVTKTYPVTLEFMNGSTTEVEQIKLYGQSIRYTLDDNGLWSEDDSYVLPETGNVDSKPGYDAGWKIEGSSSVLTVSSKVSGWPDDRLKVVIANDEIVAKPTVQYTVNGNITEDPEAGVQHLSVEIDEDNPGSVGVKVTHPLAADEAVESGTYVYFKYCWWDEMDNGVNGPRSTEEPELFSSAVSSSQINRVFTDQSSIDIRSRFDARTDGDYYLVEVYGYYVENNGTPKQFYKSNHNFIAGQDGNAGEGFVMEVDVRDQTPLTITPADITIYTGGEGHEGIVSEDGNIVSDYLENGFPEPGYFITLPESLNDLLGGDENAENLTDNLTFRYRDDQGVSREWKIELYGTKENSTDIEAGGEERARYIYRLLPSTNEQIPVRLKITDPVTGNIVLNDEFNPTMAEKYKEYDMTIYAGLLDQNLVTAELVIGEESYTVPVKVENGKLTVRGVNQGSAADIVTEEAAVSADGITAVAPDGVSYYVNNTNVEVADPTGVKLLVDKLIKEDVLTEYIESDMSDLIPEGEYAYVQQYLDLVDTNNGNTYLTLGSGQSMSIYWSVPENYVENGHVRVIHFEGLDRNYDENVDEVLKDSTPRAMEPTITEIGGKQYFTFDTDSFSPFVLLYEKMPEKYTLTVKNGTGGGEYEANEQVKITADAAPAGKVFDQWITSGGGAFADAKSAETVFTMPDSNVTVTAVYKNAGGSSADSDQSGVLTGKSPKTGDRGHSFLWLTIMCISGIGVISSLILTKKRRRG